MADDSVLVVNRWRRYGKDRLYVEQADGSKVGFWDLVADTAHPESPEHLRALEQAVATWKAGQEAKAAGTAAKSAAIPAARATADEASPAESREKEDLAAALAGKPVTPTENANAPAVASPSLPVVPVEPPRPWIDLAGNRPGQATREQALGARQAAPVKTTLARVLGVHNDERAWRIGADGEEKVAAQIEKAIRKDPRWRVLHAIPVGNRGSDIDHLLIGPGGVFTVNTKHHPKAKIWVGGNTFMVNGSKVPYVRNSRHEAGRAAELLASACGFPVHVEGLIVTVNAHDVVIKNQPDGVHVTWRSNLASWMLRLGPVLAEDQISAVYEAARRSTTWSS